MELTKAAFKTTNITELSSRPNVTDGLTDATFKALFDKSVADSKDYMNNTLIVEILALFDLMHPVGSYYETSNASFDPNVSWSGTWLKDTAGRFLISQDEAQTEFDTVGKTGGEKSHTLTVDEMPSHTHQIKSNDGGNGPITLNKAIGGTSTYNIASNGVTNNTNAIYNENTGGGQAHNNLPPYKVVIRWHRTA